MNSTKALLTLFRVTFFASVHHHPCIPYRALPGAVLVMYLAMLSSAKRFLLLLKCSSKNIRAGQFQHERAIATKGRREWWRGCESGCTPQSVHTRAVHTVQYYVAHAQLYSLTTKRFVQTVFPPDKHPCSHLFTQKFIHLEQRAF